MKNSKKYFLFFICSIMMLSSLNLIIHNSNAKFINTSDHDHVIIDSLDYISGIKNVSVYSNVSVQYYNLTLNGSLLNDVMNPVDYSSGRWNASTFRIDKNGVYDSGNFSSVRFNDSNYIDINSQLAGGKEQLYVIIDFDNLDILQDYNYIQNFTIYMKYNVTDNTGDTTGALTNFDFQQWNETLGDWSTIEVLDSKGEYIRQYFYDSSNITHLNDSDNIIYDTHQYRFSGDNTAGSVFDLRLFYIWIDYNTNRTIENATDYELIDTHSFNSTQHADGTYNLSSNVVDSLNNTYNDWKWIIVDNTAPDIENITTNPSTGLNNTIPISLLTNYTENNVNNSYGYFINQFGDTVYINNYLNTTFNYTDIFVNGSYNFYFYVIDDAGNSAFKNLTFEVQHDANYVYLDPVLITYDNQIELMLPVVSTLINISAINSNLGKIEVYHNNTLNETYTSFGSIISHNLTESNVSTYNITVTLYYANLTFFENTSFLILFVDPSVINQSAYTFFIAVDDDAELIIQFWSRNVRFALLYIDGELNDNITGNTTYQQVNDSLNHGEHTILLQVYNADNTSLIERHVIEIPQTGVNNGDGGDTEEPPVVILPLFTGANIIVLLIFLSSIGIFLVYALLTTSRRKRRRK